MDSVISKQVLNYSWIHQLLSKATKQLHRIFRRRWRDYQKLNPRNINEWNDDEECGMKLARMCPSAAAPMKEMLKSGKVDSWDVTLSIIAIKSISEEIEKRGGSVGYLEDLNIERIRKLRNQIVHGKTEISDDEFEALWYELKIILVQFGESAADIEALKSFLLRFGQANTPTNQYHREERRSGYNYDAPINRYRGNGYDMGATFDRRRHANEPDYDRRRYAYDRHSPVLQSDYFRDRQYQAAQHYAVYSNENRERRQTGPLIRDEWDDPCPRQIHYRPSMLPPQPLRQRNLPSMLPPQPLRQRNLPSMLPPQPIRQPVLSLHSVSLRNYMNATENLLSALRSFTIT